MKENRQVREGFRRSQLIVPFGVGSIVDLPEESAMMMSLDTWHENLLQHSSEIEIYERRLQKDLDVDVLYMPPSEEQCPQGINFVRFPRWLFCPQCRQFKSIKEWREKWNQHSNQEWDVPYCFEDDCAKGFEPRPLVPSRFIVVCSEGHIDDFPWDRWAHYYTDKECSDTQLERTTVGASTGLSSVRVRCRSCDASNNMGGTFDSDFFENVFSEYSCSGYRPWFHGTPHEQDGDCQATPRAVQRGGSNVYFPTIDSAISIPPYTNNLMRKVRQHDAFSMIARGTDPELRQKLKDTIAEDLSLTIDQVDYVFEIWFEDSNEESLTEQERWFRYRYDEYHAFRGNIEDADTNAENFDVEDPIDGSKYNLPGVEEIVLCNRLREVRALTGFTRLQPRNRRTMASEDDSSAEEGIQVTQQEVTEEGNYPAIEVRGEGIFIVLDLEELKDWKQMEMVQKRISLLNRNFRRMADRRNREIFELYPEFILLHTLSHVLIRRLSFECGYPSASLRERIYCHQFPDDREIAGILIYTAAGDSEGTLGGLVRQGRPKYFPSTFCSAIEKALWCSSDPLCIESDGQGMNSLNLAACHACALLPETSCEEFNRFLDRAFLIGTEEHPEVGFFRDLVR